MAAKKTAHAADDDKCPNCGACQHCGHGGRQQFVPYPVYPPTYPPYYVGDAWPHYTYATSSGTNVNVTWQNNTGGLS